MESIKDLMMAHKMEMPNMIPEFKLEGADKIFCSAMAFFLSLKNEKYISEQYHSEIIEWLKSNENKGIALFGNCGTGKTFITKYVIPGIFLKYHKKVITHFDIKDLYADHTIAMQKFLICIDDVGTESDSVNYGERRKQFSEIIDDVEKKGKLLIFTTNLSIEEFKNKYGERVFDRVKSTVKPVIFNGKSFRK